MRRSGPKLSRIFALGLALSATAFAAPSASRLPTKNIDPNKETSDYSPADMKCNAGQDDNADCAHQNDAMLRSAQAYSYLAFYMQNESLFAKAVMGSPKEKSAMQKAVTVCLQTPNSSECDDDAKLRMMRALIHYNLGKDVRSMVLQNNTNYENMKSIALPAGTRDSFVQGKMRGVRGAGRTYTSSFKITKQDMNTSLLWDPKAMEDVSKLGQNFRNEYESFIDTYTNTKHNHPQLDKQRWAFNHGRAQGNGNPSEANRVWEIDPSTNAPVIRRDRQFWDEETQDRAVVKNQVMAFKKSLDTPLIKEAEADPKDKHHLPHQHQANGAKKPRTRQLTGIGIDESLRFNALGLGAPQYVYDEKTGKTTEDPQLVNANLVARMNAAVEKSAQQVRQKNPGKIVDNVQLNIENFDQYLDEIWPKTGYQYRIPSSEK